MISQGATILCFWSFLYPTEAMNTKSTKRSLCDIQTSLFSVLILLINPHFEISIWLPPMLPRQSSSMLEKCHFFLLCRFPHSQHTIFALYFPLLLPLPYCFSLIHDFHSCSHLLTATPASLMTKSHKSLKETQDTSKIKALPQRRFMFWLYQLIFNFHSMARGREELSPWVAVAQILAAYSASLSTPLPLPRTLLSWKSARFKTK